MYSLVTAALSSRSWYRTWNSSAYHHWDPKQTVSYKFFLVFFFSFLGGSDIAVVNRVIEEAEALEESRAARNWDHLSVSTASGGYFASDSLLCETSSAKMKNTHTHTHAQRADMINSDGKGKKKLKYVVMELFFFIIIDMPKPPNLFE